jgi:hypothetical protein
MIVEKRPIFPETYLAARLKVIKCYSSLLHLSIFGDDVLTSSAFFTNKKNSEAN